MDDVNDDVFVKKKNSFVTSADVYCIIHDVFFVPIVFKILVIREQRGEQHHRRRQHDEE